MRFHKTKSFQKMWEKLSDTRRQTAGQALYALDKAIQGGLKPEGLGLKKLRKPFWEIRTGLIDRILFTFEKDLITFVLIGSHDEIHRFLKNQ